MQKLIDITGNRYGYLTVLGFSHMEYRKNGKSRSVWKCECDCGNIVLLRKDQFIYPYSNYRSCGCWHRIESSRRPKDKLGRFKKLERSENNDRKRRTS